MNLCVLELTLNALCEYEIWIGFQTKLPDIMKGLVGRFSLFLKIPGYLKTKRKVSIRTATHIYNLLKEN